jgi:putative flippase GtrA
MALTWLRTVPSERCSWAAISAWHRPWTFPESRRRPLRSQLPIFLSVYAVGYQLNQVLFLGSYALIFGPLFAPGLGVNLAKALANLLGLFWNFGANRVTTFRGL